MKKSPLPLHFPSVRRLARQWRAWKWIPLNNQKGFSTVFVAVMLLAILTLLAFFMNVGGALITRQKLETMAEFGAAGGGRLVAEKIADIATSNISGPNPKSKRKYDDVNDRHTPENYLFADDRLYLQSEPFISEVKQTVKQYLELNKPVPMNFDVNDTASVEVNYPQGGQNECKTDNYDVTVGVTLHYTYPFFMQKLSEQATRQSGIPLTVNSLYSVRICD